MEPKSPQSSAADRVGLGDEPDEASAAGSGCDDFHTVRDRRNERRFNFWLFATMFAYVGATFARKWPESVPVAIGWTFTAAAWLLAVQATRSYLIFLREADELLRRIQTEALALGFVAGAALSLLYPLLEPLGAPRLDAKAVAVVMLFAWGGGSWLGTRRYAGKSGG